MPRLSECASKLNLPAGIETTVFPAVAAQRERMGIKFDQWQAGIGTVALGKRENGKYACGVGGVVLPIPRLTPVLKRAKKQSNIRVRRKLTFCQRVIR